MRLLDFALIALSLVFMWMVHAATSMNMVSRDLKSNTKALVSLTTQVVTADVTTPTHAIDTRDFDSAMFVVTSGTVTTAGIAKGLAYESDDGTTWTAVAAADLVGAFTNMAAADLIQTVGYVGQKRYIGLGADYISGTSIILTGIVIEGDAHYRQVT